MVFTDEGIVLIRQNFREADRMVCLYARNCGRINLRFPGVNRSAGKLKALSEPFVHADYRIYVRNGAAVGCASGGKVESVFAPLRADAAKTKTALHFCELMFRLTPENSPNEEKFELLLNSLRALEKTPVTPSIGPAFLLRLMTLAGFGMDKPALNIPEDFWDKMHNAPYEDLDFKSKEDLVNLNKTSYICRRFLNAYLPMPVNTLKETPAAHYSREEELEEAVI